MATCTRNASCKCEECMAAMGMFTAKDLQSIASSTTFDDEPLMESNDSTPLSSVAESAPLPQETGSTDLATANSVTNIPYPTSKEAPSRAVDGEKLNVSNTNSLVRGDQSDIKVESAQDVPFTSSQEPVQSIPLTSSQPPPSVPGEPEQGQDFSEVPLGQRLESKDWKARKHGYEEIRMKLEANLDQGIRYLSDTLGQDHKKQILNALSKEKNVGALDVALDASAVYVSSEVVVPSTLNEELEDFIKKFIQAVIPSFDKRVTSRKRGIKVCCALFGAGGKASIVVVDALGEGIKGKSPKQVTGCLEALSEICKAFGAATMPMKSNLEALQTAFTSKHVLARKESMQGFASELVKWLGEPMIDMITNLGSSAAQKKEIETTLKKVDVASDRVPEQQVRGAEKTTGGDNTKPKQAVDLFDMMEEHDIIPKLDSIKFSQRIQAAKWSERKAVLVELQKLCGEPPKLKASADYHSLEHSLQLILKMDSNQAVTVQAISFVRTLCEGLRQGFAPYAKQLFPLVIPRYKDKKSVLSANVDKCLDSLARWCLSFSDERVLGIIKENVAGSNPVHHRMCVYKWLGRTVTSGLLWDNCCDEGVIEPLMEIIVEGIGDPDSKVRAQLATTIAELLKIETLPEPIKTVVEKHVSTLKSTNPRAHSNITSKLKDGGKTNANARSKATTKPVTKKQDEAKIERAQPEKSRTGPGRATSKKPNLSQRTATSRAKTVPSSQASSSKAPASSGAAEVQPISLDKDAAFELVSASLNIDGFQEQLEVFKTTSKWQEKKAFYEFFSNSLSPSQLDSDSKIDATITCLGMWSRDFKESNFNIINAVWMAAEKICNTAENPFISKGACALLLNASLLKIGDRKQVGQITKLWDAIAEVYGAGFVVNHLLAQVQKQKLPKVLEGFLTYAVSAIQTFGPSGIDLPGTLAALASPLFLESKTLPVKKAASQTVVVLYEIFGEPVRATLGPAVTSALAAQLDKATPASKTIEPSKALRNAAEAEQTAASAGGSAGDAFPRKDISSDLGPKLMEEMNELKEKNAWKIRLAAVEQVRSLLNSAGKRILLTPQVRTAAQALRRRFGDSNRNLASKAIGVLGLLATSVGPEGAVLLAKSNVGPILGCMGDSKKAVTSAAMGALDSWVTHDGTVSGSVVAAVVAQFPEHLSNSKLDRAGLLQWLCAHTVHLQASDSEEVLVCVPGLLECFKSRDAKVRRMASQTVAAMTAVVGTDSVQQSLTEGMRDVKPAVARSLLPLVEAALSRNDGGAPAVPAERKKAATGSRPSRSAAPKESAAPEGPLERKKPVAGRGVRAAPVQETATAESGKPQARAVRKPARTSARGPVSPTKAQEGAELVESEAGFVSRGPRERERRLEKGRRNRWPNVFDPKDTYRHGEMEQQLQQELEKVASPGMLKVMFAGADRGRGTRGTGLDAAFAALEECLGSQPEDVFESCDLILKWCTLHLPSTNTTMTSNLLGFLESLFRAMNQHRFTLNEVDVAAFLPHLVRKLGDKQQRFRDQVRQILRLLYKCYAASECLLYVADGASNKERNVHTRSECLNEIGWLIQDMGYQQVIGKKMRMGIPSVAVLLSSAVRASQKDIRSQGLSAIQSLWEQLGRDTPTLIGLFASHKASLGDKELTLVQNFLSKSQKRPPKVDTEKPVPARSVPSTPVAPVRQPRTPLASPPKTPPLSSRRTARPKTPCEPVEVPDTPETPKIYRELLSRDTQPARVLSFDTEVAIPARRVSTNTEVEASAAARRVGLDFLSVGGKTSASGREETKRPMVEFHRRIKDMVADLKVYLELIQRTKLGARVLKDAATNEPGLVPLGTSAKDGPVRERGYKSLALLGTQSPPPGVLSGGEEWISFLAKQLSDKGVSIAEIASILMKLLEICAPITCTTKGEAIARDAQDGSGSPLHKARMDDQQEERRYLRLILPALFTVSSMEEFQQSNNFESLTKTTNLLCVVISNLMLQWQSVQVTSPTSNTEDLPEVAHDLQQELRKLLKLSQGVFATLLQSRHWLAVVVRMLRMLSQAVYLDASPAMSEESGNCIQLRILRNSIEAFSRLQSLKDNEHTVPHNFKNVDMKKVGEELTAFALWASQNGSHEAVAIELVTLGNLINNIYALPQESVEYQEFVNTFNATDTKLFRELLMRSQAKPKEESSSGRIDNEEAWELKYLSLVKDLRINAFYGESHPNYDPDASRVLDALHRLHASNRAFFDSLLAEKVNLSSSFKDQIQERVHLPIQ